MRVEILGIDRTSVLAAATLNVTRISKERRTCSLDVYSAASSWIPDIGQDLKIYDDDDALIFGGCLAQVRTNAYESGKGNETVLETSLFSNGYRQLAQRRAAVVAFTTSYAGTIVESLRSSVLSDEGVTAGTISVGAYYPTFTREYSPISETYDDLAQASGYKWYIDDSKALQFTQESSTPDAAHELMSTGSFYDYHDFMVTKSIDNYRNQQIVIGARDSATGLTVTATAVSTTQIAAQQAIEGGSSYSSGIYTHVIRDTNIRTTADAETAAANALKQAGYPGQISFKSFATDWQPSTKLRVKLPKYGINSDTYYLIEEVTLNKTTANELVTSIVASKRDPSDFSSQKTDDEIDYISDITRVKSELFDLNASLGNTAYEDLIEAAMLGTTVIVGGYLKTELIQAGTIILEKLSTSVQNEISKPSDVFPDINNEVSNGTFSSDTVWTKESPWTIADGVASIDGTQATAKILYQNIGSIANSDYVYIGFNILTSNGVNGIEAHLGGMSAGTYIGSVRRYSISRHASSANGNIVIQCGASWAGSIDNVVVLNLTELYGVGSEPTATQMDDMLLDGKTAAIKQGVTYAGVTIDATNGLVSTATIGGRVTRVQVAASMPYKLSIESGTSLDNFQDYIYVTSTSGYSGPNILVTSKYDINEDGRVDEEDMNILFKYVLREDIEPGTTWPLGYPSTTRMDVNDDGNVNSSDLNLVFVNAQKNDRITTSGGVQLGIGTTGVWTSDDWGETKTYIHTF